MGINQDRYFFLSGLISIGLFLCLIFLIAFTVLSDTKVQQFAMVQSDVVSISVNLSDIKVEPKQEPEPQPVKNVPQTEPIEPIKSEETSKPEPVDDIPDLFAQVKTEKSPKKKAEESKRLEQLDALEKDILKPAEKSRISDKVKNTQIVKPSITMTVEGGSTGPVVNEYHAKIQGLVYTNFHPPEGTQGQVSRVQVKISADGKLIWFKVKSRSGNSSYDNEVQWLKERLERVAFPHHPENRDTTLEFILKAKE